MDHQKISCPYPHHTWAQRILQLERVEVRRIAGDFPASHLTFHPRTSIVGLSAWEVSGLKWNNDCASQVHMMSFVLSVLLGLLLHLRCAAQLTVVNVQLQAI